MACGAGRNLEQVDQGTKAARSGTTPVSAATRKVHGERNKRFTMAAQEVICATEGEGFALRRLRGILVLINVEQTEEDQMAGMVRDETRINWRMEGEQPDPGLLGYAISCQRCRRNTSLQPPLTKSERAPPHSGPQAPATAMLTPLQAISD